SSEAASFAKRDHVLRHPADFLGPGARRLALLVLQETRDEAPERRQALVSWPVAFAAAYSTLHSSALPGPTALHPSNLVSAAGSERVAADGAAAEIGAGRAPEAAQGEELLFARLGDGAGRDRAAGLEAVVCPDGEAGVLQRRLVAVRRQRGARWEAASDARRL